MQENSSDKIIFPYVDHRNAFYDAMFGLADENRQHNSVETQVINEINQLVSRKKSITKELPCLPCALMELIELLGQESASFNQVAKVIQTDPVLSGNVLHIANSPKYRIQGEITSIESAVSLLGMGEVAEIASTVLIKSLVKKKCMYFKKFGQTNWLHSLQTAYACRLLAKNVNGNSYIYYLAGLVHAVGKVVIFHALTKAFAKILDDDMPGSLAFRHLMTSNAKQLSVYAAEDWKFPEEILLAYKQLMETPQSDLALALDKATKLSRTYLLIENNILDEEQGLNYLESLSLDNHFITSFFQFADGLR